MSWLNDDVATLAGNCRSFFTLLNMYEEFLRYQTRKPELSSFTFEHDNCPFQIVQSAYPRHWLEAISTKKPFGVQKTKLFVVFLLFVIT